MTLAPHARRRSRPGWWPWGPGLLALMLATFGAMAGDVTVNVTANRDRIYIGETVVITVTVSGEGVTSDPDLSGIKSCTVVPMGSHSETRVSVNNGRMERFVGRIYTYQLTPSNVGRFTAGPIAIRAGHQAVTAEGPAVEVVGVDAQDVVWINVVPSRTRVMVDEPFDITLIVALKRLPGRFADAQPIHQDAPPHLMVPFLDRDEVNGLQRGDLGQILTRYRNPGDQGVGFYLNGFVRPRGMFDMDNPPPMRFLFDRGATTTNGIGYITYSIKVPYVPRQEGSYTFGPVQFKGDVVVAVDDQARPAMKSIFAVGAAATVQVVPPPEEGRPPTYVGVVASNVTVETALDAQTCNVGDPLKLTLTIRGNMSADNLYPPPLSNVPSLARKFRVYEDDVRVRAVEQGKEYTYTVRPVVDGTIEFPAIEVAYFDARDHVYRTAASRPIPMRVNAATVMESGMVIAAGSNQTAVAVRTSDLFVVAPLSVSPGGASSRAIIARGHVVLVAAGPALYLLALGWMTFRRHRRTLAAALRSRGALRGAEVRLAQAEALARTRGSEAHAALCDAVRQYVQDRSGAASGSLTPGELVKALEQVGVSPSAAGEFTVILQHHFDAIYSPLTDDPERTASDVRRVRELLATLDAQRPATAPVARSVLLTLGLLVLSVLNVQAAGQETPAAAWSESRFLWEEANAAMSVARSGKEFASAASVYQRLAGSGVRNGPLFYNAGTALLLAGRHADAARWLARAERYEGSTWETRRNLLLALAGPAKDRSVSLPWYRVPFFWHFALSAPARAWLAAAGFFAMWVVLILRRLGWQRWTNALMLIAMAVFVAFGSSVITTLHQESRDDARLSIVERR